MVVVAALAVFAVTAIAVTGRASAQAPPAAVDQYKPSPPGNPDPDPNRPDRGPGDGGPDGEGAANPGTNTDAPGQGALTPSDGEGSATGTGSGGAGNDGNGAGNGGTTAASGAEAQEGGGPVVAGYPLTDALVAAIIVIAIGLCAGLGLAAWRRHRSSAALAGSS